MPRAALPLTELPIGREGVIEAITFDDREALGLRAMGVAEGRPVVVLRRAPFGGPLHVRVGDAAFALDRSLAARIRVRPDEGPP
ncbi:MAG: ferrous iron transport protein A [Polyangiaceae bacterium]|nr:ferrous iron transport protein A [Polyangiaceae bacterium]